MLEKYIIHLKNIIFLKVVVYFLAITILTLFIPRLNEEYFVSVKIFEKAQKIFNEAKLKLDSIIESGGEIIDTDKKYQSILQISKENRCEQSIKIAKEIKELKYKYNLGDEIYVGFLSTGMDDQPTYQEQIFIKNYDINILYSTEDIGKSILILKEAFSKTPANSMITSFELLNKETLNETTINNLAPARIPELVKSKINMRIRAISSNKVN